MMGGEERCVSVSVEGGGTIKGRIEMKGVCRLGCEGVERRGEVCRCEGWGGEMCKCEKGGVHV